MQFAATHKAASELLTDYREKAKKLREEAAAKKNQGPAAKGKKAKTRDSFWDRRNGIHKSVKVCFQTSRAADGCAESIAASVG